MRTLFISILALMYCFELSAQGVPQRELTMACYNIHNTIGSDGVRDLSRTAEVIRALGVDVTARREL